MTIADKGPNVGPVVRRGAQIPDLGENRIAGAVPVVDTTELRWFTEGRLPTDIKSWFTRAGATGMVEERCDTYRMDGRHDIGVKRRNRETLELKVRRSVGERLLLGAGLEGRPEVWQKWSPAEGLVETSEDVPWVDVHKIVVKRRFSVDGGEIVLSEATRAMHGAGCDVEVTAVTVHDTHAWTFAFAAFGPTMGRREALVASWQALLADAPCPERPGPFSARASGYPQWLALLTTLGRTASVAT